MSSALQHDAMEWSGDYSSLYPTLSADQVRSLEKAIHERRIGRYDEARRIFEKCLPPSHSLPVLTLERATLAQKQGLFKERSAILRESLTWKESWMTEKIGHELELIELLHAEANILAEGKLKQALEEARRLRDLLKDFALEDFTDIEVGCVASYYQIMENCRDFSNWIRPEIDPFFPMTVPALPWLGITQLRKGLLDNRRLWTSFTLFLLEVEFVDKSARAGLYEEFIFGCKEISSSESESALLLLTATNIYFAEELIDLGMKERARSCIAQAEKQLENLPSILHHTESRLCSLQCFLQRVKVLHNPHPNFGDVVEEHYRIIERAKEAMDFRMAARSFTHIFEVLSELPLDERDEIWNFHWESSSAAFSDLYSGPRACFLTDWNIIIRLNVWGFQQTLGAGQAIHLLHDFENTYRDFDIPLYNQLLYHLAETAAMVTGDYTAGWGYSRKRLAAISNSPVTDLTFTYNFHIQYQELPHDRWPRPLLEIIVGWIENEVRSGTLSVHEAVRLLCLEDECPEENLQVMTLQGFLNVLENQSAAMLAERTFGIPVPVDDETWDLRLHRYSTWLRRSVTTVPIHIRHTVLGDLQHARCSLVNLYGLERANCDPASDSFDDIQLEDRRNTFRETGRLLKLIQTLDPKALNASVSSIRVATMNHTNALILLALSPKAYRLGMFEDEDLLNAQTSLKTSLEKCATWDRTNRIFLLNSISGCMKWRYILFGTVSAEAALEPLRQCDLLYTTVRMERSVLKGIQLFTARAINVAQFGFSLHYSSFIGLCLEALGITQARLEYHCFMYSPESLALQETGPLATQILGLGLSTSTSSGKRHILTELIEWAQKKKARSVVEVLGAEILLPHNLLAAIDHESKAYKLLMEEAKLQTENPIQIGEKLRMIQRLDELRKEMRELPDLLPIMEIRDGSSIKEAQIKQMSKELGSNVLIVDYVQWNIFDEENDSGIMSMLYVNGEFCNESVDDLIINGLDMADVRRWTRTYLDVSSGESTLFDDSSEEALDALIPLVAPIAKFSKPGDTIVICPTGPLHRIPLHALKVDGQTLIERNPVVYTQSLSLLRLCVMSSLAKEPYTHLEAVVAQGLPERQSYMAPSMAFANDLGATLLCGSSLTKESFLTAMTSASLIHYHGHVGFDEDTPLDHFLDIRGLETERISTREVFELRIPSGAHVTLIGCQSGRARIGAQDNLIGLPTALHYAGASSVASTMWSINNKDGAAFSEAFYKDLLTQGLEGAIGGADTTDGSAFFDLAKAMQAAVLKIKENESGGGSKAPYHWAAFTLQGCWKARGPEKKGTTLR